MDRYLRRLERELWQRGFRGALRLMHSAGGLVSPETARAFPIRLLESGPGGRRSGHRVLRRGCRPGRRHLLRHGRHDREGLPDRGRPRRHRADDGSRARAPLQERLRPADQGAGDRHDRDRRRRRLDRRDRRGRPAARRPAFCRRRSRARPATAAAAPSRRSPTPTCCSAITIPGFFLGGRMALDRDAAERALASGRRADSA